MTSGIYAIVNIVNGNRYVGSAVDISRRWGDHCRCLRRGAHHNSRLQRAWNKYGEEAFRFEMIEECEPEMLLDVEQRLLDMLRPEYNAALVAGAPMMGRHHSEATRQKIAVANRGHVPWTKGKELPKETCRKISSALMGHEVTMASRVRMSVARTGKKNTAKVRAKISASLMGRKHSPESIAKMVAAKKGARKSPEHRAKLSAANMGKVMSAETRTKMSVAQQLRRQKEAM